MYDYLLNLVAKKEKKRLPTTDGTTLSVCTIESESFETDYNLISTTKLQQIRIAIKIKR